MFKRKRKLTKANTVLKLVSEGDLSTEISKVGRIYESNPTNGVLRKTVLMFSRLVRIVDRSTNQIYSNVTTLSDTSLHLENEVDYVATTLQELAKDIQQTENKTRKLTDELNDVMTSSETIIDKNKQNQHSIKLMEAYLGEGRLSSTHSLEIIKKLDHESERHSAATLDLLGASKKISVINEMVKNMAERINLLTLNANIEAARSEGTKQEFTTVAMEIGLLSRQSQQATDEIQSLISKVQAKIADSANRTSTVLSLVNEGVQSIFESKHALNKIEEEILLIKPRLDVISDEGMTIVESNSVSKEALQHTSTIIEQLSIGSERILASTLEQKLLIESLSTTIHETIQDMFTLSAVVSQFKLPNRNPENPLHEKVEALFKQALTVRGIMVNMINSTDTEKIASWQLNKEQAEAILARELNQLEAFITSQHDEHFLDSFKKAWEDFQEITQINQQLMLEGQYEEAKLNLVTRGRIRFKKVSDTCTLWLDAS